MPQGMKNKKYEARNPKFKTIIDDQNSNPGVDSAGRHQEFEGFNMSRKRVEVRVGESVGDFSFSDAAGGESSRRRG